MSTIVMKPEKPRTAKCAPYLARKMSKWFTTLSPVPLQKQPAVVLLLEGLRSHKMLVIREYGGHEDLRGSGHQSVIPYVHG